MTLQRAPRTPVTLPAAGVLARVQDYRARRQLAGDAAFTAAVEREMRAELRWRFRAACDALPIRGVPVVEAVNLAEVTCPRLTLVMPPAVQVADLVEVAGALAEALDVRRVTFAPANRFRVEARLHKIDPLTSSAAPEGADVGRIVFGRVDDGTTLSLRPADMPHCVVQGATGSGKSIFTYGYLAQLVACPDVQLRMSDPTGVLVRPWPSSPDLVNGLADPGAHVEMLSQLVGEMDRRMPLIPEDDDQITPGPDVPLIVCVLEEYAGLLRVGGREHREMVQGLVARLLAESRKVAIRIFMLIQRADAALIGGFERSNMPLRISFRVDNSSAIEMLHPDPGPDVVVAHSFALPGVALVSAPGMPLRRFRAPYTVYRDYAAAVRAVL